ncbi:MAG: hypothetical protein K5851_03500 [Lachnospiraceae bacterium]|nr:hypothetical protein [Lachnospiraceae bacterium]
MRTFLVTTWDRKTNEVTIWEVVKDSMFPSSLKRKYGKEGLMVETTEIPEEGTCRIELSKGWI